MFKQIIDIINILAALITIIQLFVAGMLVFSSVVTFSSLHSLLADKLCSSPTLNILLFLILELGLLLVVFYLKIQSQIKIVILLILGILSVWVSFFNVRYSFLCAL